MRVRLERASRNGAVAVIGLVLAVGTGSAYAANTIGSSDIIDESIQSVDIKDGEVKNTDLGSSSVTGTKVAPETLYGSDIRDASIYANDIKNAQITGAKLAPLAVTGDKVAADSLTGTQILESTLGLVPNADQLDGRDSSGFLQITPLAAQAPDGYGYGKAAVWLRPTAPSNSAVPAVFRWNTDGGLVMSGGGIQEGLIPASGCGERLMWYSGKGAFRAGAPGRCGDPDTPGTAWDDANVGMFSWAGGERSTASGDWSTAIGTGNAASGAASVAIGSSNAGSGSGAVALGVSNAAGGFGSTALGNGNRATGSDSVALGLNGGAFGDGSVTLGTRAVAAPCTGCRTATVDPATGLQGAFVFGDRSTTAYVGATAANQFTARAAGGFRFFTNANLTTGCTLAAGSGAFSCTSDRNSKRAFAHVDGRSVLDRLAALPVMTWQYKDEQGHVRHMGPTAQDFRRAFGLGNSSKQIGLIDEAGVSLAAVKALDARTRRQEREIAALRKQVKALLAARR
jgi:hypothetical protein